MLAYSQLYLASASPRRKEILENLGFSIHLLKAPIDEAHQLDETPENYVLRMALEKNSCARALYPELNTEYPIVSADTSVVLSGRILGKPQDVKDAKNMLNALSGCTHQVLTALCVSLDDIAVSLLQTSSVTFKTLSQDEIDAYIQTGEPMDKAGAYGIQGLAAFFVTYLSGSHTGVMGLPVYEFGLLIKELKFKSKIR